MGLAVLVIDLPKMCIGCSLNQSDSSIRCRHTWTGKSIPSWCPLKPLPEYEKPQDPDETWEEMHVRMGYNKCLEDITNEP